MIDRLNAALEGSYRIEGELGEGGMATVYLAEDVRHRRKVALKVLRPELAAVVGGERFLAEIQVTANLQHPHILPLFDSGEADGFLFYVMPYVEGESLREKLDREHQLPVDEAVRIALAVASGLDYAHRQGVVHRDIKPANILLHDGEPLVADFGIALAVQEAGGGRLTETGLSLGTPFYMSPEQATADRDPGPRSDVYSLGCVLYEMLTGDPPFTGSTAQNVLGKIITTAPVRPTETRKSIPAHVEAALLHALEKLPADRFGSAAEFAQALQDPRYGQASRAAGAGSAAGAPPPPRSGIVAWLPWGVAALALAALALVLNLRGDGGSAAPATALRATLQLPANAAVTESQLAISRDGGLVVVPGSWNGVPMILGRRLTDLDVFPIPGTEGGTNVFLSPDGQWAAFRRAGATRKTPVAGGPIEVMDPEADWAGGSWAPDDRVYYNRSYVSGVWWMPAGGGEPQQLTKPADGELAHWWPQALPDGEHVLFTAFRTPVEQSKLSVVSVETGERTDVFTGGIYGRYVSTGHLLFARSEVIYAVPFDLETLTVTGEAVPVVENVAMTSYDGVAAYDVSDNGTLVYVRASDFNTPADLVWVDRQGREERLDLPADRYWDPALSPSGRSLAVSIASSSDAGDLHVLDLIRGTKLPLTSGGGADFAPVWTPDGREIIYAAESPVFNLFRRPADASRPSSSLFQDRADQYPGSFTPDGDTLLFEHDVSPYYALEKIPLSGGEPQPVYAPDFSLNMPLLSPNGRWLAYTSEEAGRDQLFLSPYADPTASRRQVSVNGGEEPRWTRNGRELVFRWGAAMLAVSVDPETGELGRPQTLFEGAYESSPDGTSRNYDVTADGERFLMVKRPPDRAPRQIVVVTNFFDRLRALDSGDSGRGGR